ncbi:glycosyl transferase family 2 [Methanolobus psychrophilus R15]|nr:glycosyl transferase family 2 [Methanolobus psychrophilus R15]
MSKLKDVHNNYIMKISKKYIHDNDLDYAPTVSFCIPTKNEEVDLENCLKSIINQNYADIEIIIVDGYSTDKTVEIAKKYNCSIYYDDVSLANARQISVEKSSKDIVAIWDADIIIPHENWLRDAVKCFIVDEKISTVWPTYNAPPTGSWVQKCHISHSMYIFEDRIKNNRGIFGGGNCLFKRKHVIEVGGFDTSYDFGEDMILAKRLKEAGYKVIQYDDSVYHDTMKSLKALYKRSLWGSKAFESKGLDFYQQTKFDILKEQYYLGFKGMMNGLIKGQIFWFIFPLLFIVKSLAYGKSIFFAKN